MLAVLDETYPELAGGMAYVVGAAVVLVEEAIAREAVAGIFAGTDRRRPFHWHQEGPTARGAMVDALIAVEEVAHVTVHYPTRRRRLEAARTDALRTVVPRVVDDGASLLLIESRGEVEDRRDRAVILDTLNRHGRPGVLSYEWRDKREALLWLADGICGAVREHLLKLDDGPFTTLHEAGVIDALTYIRSS